MDKSKCNNLLQEESRPDIITRTATLRVRYSRILFNRVMVAFHYACDEQDYEVAEAILKVLDRMLKRKPIAHDGKRRQNIEGLVAGYERIWHAKHKEIN